jgi:hypothetical protein
VLDARQGTATTRALPLQAVLVIAQGVVGKAKSAAARLPRSTYTDLSGNCALAIRVSIALP